MSERLEKLRQEARAEAALRERAVKHAKALGQTSRSQRGAVGAAYGETACPRCGVRSGIGCRHQSADRPVRGVTSQNVRGTLSVGGGNQ